MTVSSNRVADLKLRGRHGSLPARVYWPTAVVPTAPKPLLVFFPATGPPGASAALCQQLCAEAGVVVLAASFERTGEALPEAVAVTQWALDHAASLEGDPRWLLVGGQAVGGRLAAAVAAHARYEGWPPIAGLVLLEPGAADPVAVLRRALAPDGRAR